MVDELSSERIHASVRESYPNCPKYIQKRHLGNITAAESDQEGECSLESLNESVQGIISHADTFFVASVLPGGLVDVSHRGGHPGFVLCENDRTLLIPDYPGNSMYNTLGNFAVNPRAGLLFFDYSTGRMVQVRGSVTILHDRQEDVGLTGGTKRWWRLQVAEVRVWRCQPRCIGNTRFLTV